MSRVASKDTSAEMRVRQIAHSLGLRFRLHRRDLPGSPDLVFPRYKIALFVHGCFWHRHPGCKKASMPKSHIDYWLEKFEQNTARDRTAMEELERMGWRPAIVWECETKNKKILSDFLVQLFNIHGATN